MENDKMFSLMEKMYVEMQRGFSSVNDRLDKVGNETASLRNETTSLKNEVLKTNIKIENDIIPKIEVLFDPNKQRMDKQERLEYKIEELIDRVDDLRLDINGLNMKATRTDSKLIEFDKYLRDVSKK